MKFQLDRRAPLCLLEAWIVACGEVGAFSVRKASAMIKLRLPAFISAAIRMVRLIEGPWWMAPGIILLNILAFLSEGFGISLLIPLLTRLSANQDPEGAGLGVGSSGLLDYIDAVAQWFAGPYQVQALVGLIVFFIFIRSLCWISSRAAFGYASGRIGHLVRMRALEKLYSAPQSYVDAQPPGRLLNILSAEASRLSDGMLQVAGLVTNATAVLVFLGLMLLVSVKLTLIVGVGMIGILAIVYLVTSRARRFGKQLVAASTSLSARIGETLNGLRTILLFNRDREERARFEKESLRVWDRKFKLVVLDALPNPLIMLLSASFIGLLIVIAGDETLMTLVLFLVLLQRLQPASSRFMQARISLMSLAGSLDQVETFLADTTSAPLPDGDRPAPAPRQSIRLENVRYRYPRADRDAVSGLSIDIPVGKTTALVGHSGSGKSTVLSLICRNFDPDEGAVLVDGASLREFQLRSWRARVAVVPQEVFLFDDTIRANIAFGKIGATDAEIAEAIRTAGAAEFIEQLREGLDTRVGDRGSQFSGGQRQRIALARAIVSEPDLLILDEATNALDNLSARLVQDAVQRASAGRTVLVVAHRLAPVRDADHVVVLDKGRAVEAGAPDALLRAGGFFSRLVAAETVAA